MGKDFFCNLILDNGEVINIENKSEGLLDQDVVNAALLRIPKSAIKEVEVGNQCNEIGFHAFFGCINLVKINIPKTVTAIGASAFFNCKSLASITFPSSVKLIENYAFDTCISLASIVIPASVKILRRKAFNNCSGLKSIIINSATPPEMTGASAFDYSFCPIYVPEKSVIRYKRNKNWKVYSERITAI